MTAETSEVNILYYDQKFKMYIFKICVIVFRCDVPLEIILFFIFLNC